MFAPEPQYYDVAAAMYNSPTIIVTPPTPRPYDRGEDTDYIAAARRRRRARAEREARLADPYGTYDPNRPLVRDVDESSSSSSSAWSRFANRTCGTPPPTPPRRRLPHADDYYLAPPGGVPRPRRMRHPMDYAKPWDADDDEVSPFEAMALALGLPSSAEIVNLLTAAAAFVGVTVTPTPRSKSKHLLPGPLDNRRRLQGRSPLAFFLLLLLAALLLSAALHGGLEAMDSAGASTVGAQAHYTPYADGTNAVGLKLAAARAVAAVPVPTPAFRSGAHLLGSVLADFH